jgi:hypothetical protein
MLVYTQKTICSYKTMKEMIIGSTSSSSNIHRFTNNNSNHYRSMVINATRMNCDYLGEDSYNIPLDEEYNCRCN